MSLPPSEPVRIQPAATASGTVRNTTGDHWAALGFELPGLLTEAWGMQESRMDIDPAVDTRTRYDIVFNSPEPYPAVLERIRAAIADQLELSITTEARWMEILVLKAPASPVAYSLAYESGVGARAWNCDWTPVPPDLARTPGAIEEWLKSQIQHIPAIGIAFPQNQLLPFSRGILMLGEVEEDGSCSIQIECMGPHSEEQILLSLHQDLGIEVSKEHRNVKLLVVRPLLR